MADSDELFPNLKREWRELVNTVKNINKPTDAYGGVCPCCHSSQGFYQQVSAAIKHGTKLNGVKGFTDAVTNPKKKLGTMAWELLTNPRGEPAHCKACDRAVLRCPKCKTIAEANTWVTCSGCGTKYVHP